MVCVLVFIDAVRIWSRNLIWIAAFNFPAVAMVFTVVCFCISAVGAPLTAELSAVGAPLTAELSELARARGGNCSQCHTLDVAAEERKQHHLQMPTLLCHALQVAFKATRVITQQQPSLPCGPLSLTPNLPWIWLQNQHVGSQVVAAARMNGDLLVGTVMGGVACQLARLPGKAFTTFLCVFAAVAMVAAATVRARWALSAAWILCSTSGACMCGLGVMCV